MDRDKQIELMESAEVRTTGHVSRWIAKSARLKAALHRHNEDRVEVPVRRFAGSR